jgi:hypothetical protein
LNVPGVVGLFRYLELGFKSLLEKKQKKESANAISSFDAESNISRLWGWALPLLLGLTAGWFGMICLELWLEGRNARNRPVVMAASFTAYPQGVDSDQLAAFLRVNPFGITPMPSPYLIEEEEEPPPQITGTLALATLIGTSPGSMAWMMDQGELRLVLVGDKFGEHTLVEVTQLDATFIYGDERVLKELVFGNSHASAPPPARRPSPPAQPAGQVVASDPVGGTTGVISREMMIGLMENPFDELRNIRIRPADTGQGLRVEWITNDSVLSQLGVQQDDVVSAINGIAFRNTQDIMNSMNSMMHSDQFIVEVVRNGVPTLLQYVVR